MLKLSRNGAESFQNLKCGEIYCITAAVLNVSCCICDSEMHLEQFTSHFQMQHLSLVEESINLEVLEKRRKIQLANDSCLLEQIPIKEEDPVEDHIKQEDLESPTKLTNILEEENTEDDEDNKCLQKLVVLSKARQKKRNREKSKEDTKKTVVSRKHRTTNAPSPEFAIEEKIEDPLQTKEYEGEIPVTPLVVENLSTEELDCNEVEVEEDNRVAAKEWSSEETYSESDSGPDKDQSVSDKKGSAIELPFSCPLCKRSYRTKHGLQKHNHSVHNPNKPAKKRKVSKPQHKCDICSEVFRSAPVLRGHQWKHTGIFCDICGKTFTQSGHLTRHKIRHTGIKDFKCKECNKEFFTAKELKSHMVSHTKVMPVICEICGKGCRNLGVLTAHMRRHTGERPAKCDVCGKCFFSVHDLNVHAVTHTSERPFKCDICGSTFQRKKALRVHKRIHSKDRKHVCRVCGKGFAQSGGLNSHMRTHDAAIEKTTSIIETSSAIHIPAAVLMSSAEDTRQTETDVMSYGKELGEQVIDEFIV